VRPTPFDCFHFHSAPWFVRTMPLARWLNSLVRVSRRDDDGPSVCQASRAHEEAIVRTSRCLGPLDAGPRVLVRRGRGKPRPRRLSRPTPGDLRGGGSGDAQNVR
jgi:hypothetical protein